MSVKIISIFKIIVMEKVSYIEGRSSLDAVFAALADPTRRAILRRLAMATLLSMRSLRPSTSVSRRYRDI